eukprot:5126918-Prymnesium_polylepis.1
MPMDESQLAALRSRLQEAKDGTSVADERSLVRDSSRDPLREGLAAGAKCGAVTTLLGAGAVHLLRRRLALWAHVTPAGNAFIVATAGMAGFFVASEKAVLTPKKAAVQDG